MKKTFNFLLLTLAALVLYACGASSPEKMSLTYAEQADRDMPSYSLNKSVFYGYQPGRPLPPLPSGVSIQFDKQSGGNKYVFADPKGTFTFITLYETGGLLTRVTLTRKDTSASQSNDFYKMMLQTAADSYPKKVLVDSGIGAYMHFDNDPDKWRENYVVYLEKKDQKNMYKLGRQGFHLGLHESLKTVSINQFAGRESKYYVTMDYVTAAYEQAAKNAIKGLQKSIQEI